MEGEYDQPFSGTVSVFMDMMKKIMGKLSI
jgi:hypothetical protein